MISIRKVQYSCRQLYCQKVLDRNSFPIRSHHSAQLLTRGEKARVRVRDRDCVCERESVRERTRERESAGSHAGRVREEGAMQGYNCSPAPATIRETDNSCHRDAGRKTGCTPRRQRDAHSLLVCNNDEDSNVLASAPHKLLCDTTHQVLNLTNSSCQRDAGRKTECAPRLGFRVLSFGFQGSGVGFGAPGLVGNETSRL